MQEANHGVQRDKNKRPIGNCVHNKILDMIVQTAGYNSWGDFKENYANNHKVVSVEILPDREDTGDITVESPSGSHVFALAAGVYIHNSVDGRGSKVETLPGGELTGEIGDLMFFSRKLARGLRVPTSYLNLGEDEGNNVTFNDGKLGAAMIQEYRFSKFCMRLQSLIAPIFDKELKRFMIKNGVELDWNLFELQFAPPQSFTRYRQIELDSQRVQVYQGVAENKFLAQRFKLIRYLGLTERRGHREREAVGRGKRREAQEEGGCQSGRGRYGWRIGRRWSASWGWRYAGRFGNAPRGGRRACWRTTRYGRRRRCPTRSTGWRWWCTTDGGRRTPVIVATHIGWLILLVVVVSSLKF